MGWEDIIKREKPESYDFYEVIQFFNRLCRETLDKIEAKEGIEPIDLTDGAGGASLKGFYYSPNYVLAHTPEVGYHEEGFKPELPDGDNKISTYTDWYDWWDYGFGKEINETADEMNNEKYRLKEEDKEVYPVVSYLAGSYDYENGTFQLYCKNEDAWAESLMTDVHRKIEERFGKSDGKERYTPQFSIGIDEETGEKVTAEQAIERDKRATKQKDWRDSLQGKE
jgi:hypothetical protein|tara:strand:+ start:401 stop:1075 length:675 start_codon:yes stop_codon:yes gene_type:complete